MRQNSSNDSSPSGARIKMRSPTKPSLNEVLSFLANNNALIVHFSGTPKGVGMSDKYYPEDLQDVLHGKAQGGLSCSVVKPGDEFHSSNRNTTGSVGVVIKPTTPESIIAVSHSDLGSYIKDGVRHSGPEVDISTKDLEDSLTLRDNSYNEWSVRNFEVLGLFLAEPAEIWARPEKLCFNCSSRDAHGHTKSISVVEVANQFGNRPIYKFSTNEIYKWDSNQWTPIQHSAIY